MNQVRDDSPESSTAVFCESYIALFVALALHDEGRHVSVITNNAAIATACCQLGIACKELTFGPSPGAAGRTGAWRLLQLRHTRRWVKTHVAPDTSLYFTHTQFSTCAFALAKAWSDRGPVILWDVEQAYPSLLPHRRARFLRAHVRRFIQQWLSGLDHLELRDDGYRPVLSIGQAFIARYDIQRPSMPDIGAMRAQVARRHALPLGRATNLLCTQPIGMDYPIDSGSLERLYCRLATYDIVVKLHPRETDVPAPLSTLATYPAHLPAELVLGNVSNAVLALHSSVLLTAARLPHITPVCLMDLVEWTSPALKSEVRRFIDETAGTRILYPASFDELDQVLRRDS